jgi:DNA-binding NtrC family response regulator
MDAIKTLQNLKTLLVDDDPFIRDAMQLAFQCKKLHLRTAATAEDGLKALFEEPFDVIISDYQLPGINGVTFLKQAVLSQPSAVKVLISANGDDGLISEAYGIGASDFLQKPFTVETLWATLVMHVGKNGCNGDEIFEKAILVSPTENRTWPKKTT